MRRKRKGRNGFAWPFLRFLALITLAGGAILLLESGKEEAAKSLGWLCLLVLTTYV